jgi:hypothetical protein
MPAVVAVVVVAAVDVAVVAVVVVIVAEWLLADTRNSSVGLRPPHDEGWELLLSSDH